LSFDNFIFWYLSFNLYHKWYLSFRKRSNWYPSQVFRPKINCPPHHCHLAPLGTQHLSLTTCQHPYNCHFAPKSVNDVGMWCGSVWVIWQLCRCWHVARDMYRVLSGVKWQWRGGPLVFRRKTWLRYQFGLFFKTEVPSMIQIETQIAKNKVVKTQVPIEHLTLI
jgi:hypothetical protein